MSRQFIAALMILFLMSSNLTLVARAEESVESLNLTREEAATMLLENNYTLELLAAEEVELMNDFSDAVEDSRTLSDLYDQLSTYQYLEDKYETTMADDDYQAYLNLLLDGVGSGEDDLEAYLEELAAEISALEAEEAAEAAEGTETDTESSSELEALYDLYEDVESRIAYEGAFTDSDYSAMLTASQYYTYLDIVSDFEDAGLYTSSYSDQETYDTFIYTMDVVPLARQMAIKIFQSELEAETASLINTMLTAYDGALTAMMNEKDLLMDYETAMSDLTEAEDYLALGKGTESACTEAEYDVVIAYMNYRIMKRTAENSLLDLKEMLGIDPEVTLSLDDTLQAIELADKEDYLAAASECPAIEQMALEIDYDQRMLEIMEDYLDDDDDDITDMEESISELEEDLDQLEMSAEMETRAAYNSVMTGLVTLSYNDALYEVNQASLDKVTFMYEMGQALWSDVLDQESVMEGLTRSMLKDQLDTLAAIRTLEYTSGMYVYEED